MSQLRSAVQTHRSSSNAHASDTRDWEPKPSRIDMCITCKYVRGMAKMIQVRNVPDALHRSLKARAAMAGMSLSDYLLGEFREIAERPTLAEFRERLHKRKALPVALDTGGLIREERTAR